MKFNIPKLVVSFIVLLIGLSLFSYILLAECNGNINIQMPGAELQVSPDLEEGLCKLINPKFGLMSIVAVIMVGIGLTYTIKGVLDGIK